MGHYTQAQEQDVDQALAGLRRLVLAAESLVGSANRIAAALENIAESLDAFNGMQSALLNRYDGEPDSEDGETYPPYRGTVDVELPPYQEDLTMSDAEATQYMPAPSKFDSADRSARATAAGRRRWSDSDRVLGRRHRSGCLDEASSAGSCGGTVVRLDEVDPHLVRALQGLFDEWGPAGVANVVALMRGEPEHSPETFGSRLERAAERAYTRTPVEPVDAPAAAWQRLQVIHDGPPHWENYSG